MWKRAAAVGMLLTILLTTGCLDELQSNPVRLVPLINPVLARGASSIDIRYQVLDTSGKGLDGISVYLLLPNLNDAAFSTQTGIEQQSLTKSTESTEIDSTRLAGIATAQLIIRPTTTTSISVFAAVNQPEGEDGGGPRVITSVLRVIP